MQANEKALPERVVQGSADIMGQAVAGTRELVAWLDERGLTVAIAALVAFGAFVGLRILRGTIYSALHRKKSGETSVRNIVAHIIRATRSIFLFSAAFVLVLPIFAELTEGQQAWIGRVFTVIFAFQVAFWARVVVKAFLEREANRHATGDDSSLANALGLLNVLASVIIFAVALLYVIDNLGGDVTALIAGLGVGGIAIGLAAQSLFEDLFAGLSIILDKPFVRGDFIIFGDKMGSVQKVGLKSTRITTLQGQQLVVNNSKLLSYEINNYRRMAERRVVIKLGVTYQTPRQKLASVPDAIKGIVEGQEGVRFDRCHLSGYGDFAVLFELVFWVQDRDYTVFMDKQQAVLLGIHDLFERNSIEFAYPTQTLHVETMPKG
ncbi:mechanosensitive ion channel family protein [Parvularcula sp. ZS-1/3]|uniref:Mechanosensitive ion channel family protein n=1 Tax=Parvularcula mediterranea TaxID=2732508 RepID=A0A7Y3W4L0_9PROT|nr:mechanosensitive ion channel family protein [Parvularcula mediterranea]NNU15351.1 mechanosensitive ion channel family protein [Parvularcula mediterranea]